MQCIGYVVLVLYLRPMSTWWVVWLVACWPRWLPRTFYGTHFKLGRPGSPGQWNLTGSRQIKKTSVYASHWAVVVLMCCPAHSCDGTALDCRWQHSAWLSFTALECLWQHSTWLTVTAQCLTVCDSTALDCLWQDSAWLSVTSQRLIICDSTALVQVPCSDSCVVDAPHVWGCLMCRESLLTQIRWL